MAFYLEIYLKKVGNFDTHRSGIFCHQCPLPYFAPGAGIHVEVQHGCNWRRIRVRLARNAVLCGVSDRTVLLLGLLPPSLSAAVLVLSTS